MAKKASLIPVPLDQQKEEDIALFLREGTSDKVYHVHLKAYDDGWRVNFEYGRRGSALRAGTKTEASLPYEEAKNVYDSLVNRQIKSGGYTRSESGVRFQDVAMDREHTGIKPQLLNPIADDDEAAIERYLNDDDWVMQEKHDGERRPVRRVGDDVTAANKQGLRAALPLPIEADVKALTPQQLVLDTEDMGDHLMVFDLLEIDGQDLREAPYQRRLAALTAILSESSRDGLRLAETAVGTSAKRAMFERIKAASRHGKGEGVVFKRLAAPYTVGRPAQGGDQIKCKFYAEATVVVTALHKSKRSMSVAAFDDQQQKIDLGNVGVPANKDLPAVNDLVEVRYLYAYEGGKLFQPFFKMLRTDQTLADCTMKQLKIKAKKPVAMIDDDDEAEMLRDAAAAPVTSPAKPRIKLG